MESHPSPYSQLPFSSFNSSLSDMLEKQMKTGKGWAVVGESMVFSLPSVLECECQKPAPTTVPAAHPLKTS